MFGMHPNAEIGYLTAQTDTIFATILEVQGGSGGAGGSSEDAVKGIMDDYRARTPEAFNMIVMEEKAKEKSPFVVVCLQECERMNVLLKVIKTSLTDLDMGLSGALNMTEQMENLALCLQYNKVPPDWEKVAYYSKKSLILWFADLIERVKQFADWSKELVTPDSLCISYLFNPMSFLTAIMQFTAR